MSNKIDIIYIDNDITDILFSSFPFEPGNAIMNERRRAYSKYTAVNKYLRHQDKEIGIIGACSFVQGQPLTA